MFASYKKQLGFLILMTMLCSGLVPVAQAASAPNIFTYQARVLNANGVRVSSTSLNMSFELYTALNGGTCVWSNSSSTCASTTARAVTLTSGLLTENLGDTGASYAAIPDSLFADNASIFLQVTISGETLAPRRQITAAPYALNADTLDGIDSTVLQLFETGSSRTFEDDAPVIVGSNSAFSFGSGGTGDLRVEDELEVMGDGYIDNDLVVGASTSSTETISNVAFSLGGNDLFVSGSLGVEEAIFLDGTMSIATSQAGADAAEISFTLGDDADADTVNALELLVTSAATGDADILRGLSIGDLTSAQAGVAETGIVIGSGWDTNLAFADTTANIAISNTGNLVVHDGTNTLFTIQDQGSTGLVTVAGNLFTTADITVQGDNLDSDGGPLVINVNAADEVRIGGGTPGVATGAGDLYVADALEVDGALDVGGVATVLDLSCTDCLDFSEFGDAMTLDASTSIAMDGTETFTISNGSSANVITDLTSTGDIEWRSGGVTFFTGNNDRSLDYSTNQTTTDAFDFTADSLTTAIALDVSALALTSGNILRLVGGNFTDDSGRALIIDVTESTTTADIVLIQTDSGSTDNNVFRIEADGEVFSDIGFTAGAFSTNYLDGEIQTTSDMLLDIDGGDLTFDQATVIGDGADALTINSSGTLTVDDDTILGTGALTIQSGGSAGLALNAASGHVRTASGDDFAVGSAQLLAAFSVDESANLVRVGDATGTNGQIDIYASNGSTGSLSWTTSDYLDVAGGGLSVSNLFDFTDQLSTPARTVISSSVNPSGTLAANSNEYSGYFSVSSVTNRNGNTLNVRGVGGFAVFSSDSVGGPSEVTGVYGYGRHQSNSQTTPAVSGIHGVANSSTSGGTITSAYGVLGEIDSGAGDITTGYGGSFANISDGTNRYGVIASASGGTNNFAGYFHSSRVQIDDNSTANTPGVATGAGDLYIVDALELDGILDISAVAPPVADMVTISNVGQATTTNGVSAIQITHTASNATTDALSILPAFAGGATDGLLYQALNISAFSPTNAAGLDTVVGLNIATLTDPGSTITSDALTLGSGWDSNINFKDTTAIVTLEDAGTLTVRDSALNALFMIQDSGSTGTASTNSLISPNDATLSVTGGFATVVGDAGENLVLTSGTNSAGGSGGSGGLTFLRGGAATGDGTVARSGGDVNIEGGASTVSTGNAGSVKLIGGDSSAGANGNIDIQSGGSPTVITVTGGDIALSSDDDFFLNSDDDVTFDAISAAAVINLFDNATAKTIEIGGNTSDGTDTISVASSGTSPDTIVIGNTNTSTTIGITGGNDWSVTATGLPTFRIARGNAYTEAICYSTNDAEAVSLIEDCVGAVNADYAEQYPMEEGIDYGEVVVPGSELVRTYDEQQGEQFIAKAIRSTTPYQGPVYGVVSNNYHEFTSAGNNIDPAENPMPVALVGRVPVKVVAENGAIAIGDFLATSSTPGAAMKAVRAGRVIGMALENWNGESDTVMIQVLNSWYMGDVIGEDGTSSIQTSNVIVTAVDTASANTQSFDSYGLSLRGSAWSGFEAQAVEMMLQNTVEDGDNYRLSIRNTSETEVAYITNEGTMRIAGDMVIGGNLYPSDRGETQTEKYIYYDGSSGAGGDFMRTNAKGWSTGSYDFAEMFPSNESLTSGDIVAFTGSGESVKRSSGVEGEQLAGIVSTRPGFLAGENVDGAYPIALAGRVPTKVTLENGAIAAGDPLTASTTSGSAMKATEAGQIVGYALESYAGSESDNLILAYVNLGYWSGGPETITIVQNQASEAPSDTQSYSTLNMSGNIYMSTNAILSIGRLEGMGEVWSVESDGTIKTQGELKTVTDSYQGTKVETVAITSPESVITLTGTATLVDGQAEVRFEDVVPEFNDVISAIAPIRVIVTPSGPVSLYVSEKDQNHFLVQRFAGSADVEFDWMVTGYRKGFEPSPSVIPSEVESEVEGSPSDETSEFVDPSSTDETPQDDTNATVNEEEPAIPESPDTTQVDSATEVDGGLSAEPADVVIENPSAQP